MAYYAVGDWYYVEPSLSGLMQVVLWVLIGTSILFALGTFCLIAGLLTPPALARRGPGSFLRRRLTRLGVPVLAYLVLVTPAIKWLIAQTTGSPTTVGAVMEGQLWKLDPGPLWFAAVLLLFAVCRVAWRRVRSVPGPGTGPLRMCHLLVGAGLIAALSFPIRLVFPMDSWQPLVVHLWLLPQLAVLFAFGLVAGERGWLASRPPPLVRRVCLLAPPAALAAVGGTVVTTGSVMLPYLGGWHWQAAVLAGAEGVVAVGVSLALIDLFRKVGNWQGKLAGALARDSYSAYVLQAPILVALELALSRLTWPGEVKLVLTAPAGIAACFALARALRRASRRRTPPTRVDRRRPSLAI